MHTVNPIFEACCAIQLTCGTFTQILVGVWIYLSLYYNLNLVLNRENQQKILLVVSEFHPNRKSNMIFMLIMSVFKLLILKQTKTIEETHTSTVLMWESRGSEEDVELTASSSFSFSLIHWERASDSLLQLSHCTHIFSRRTKLWNKTSGSLKELLNTQKFEWQDSRLKSNNCTHLSKSTIDDSWDLCSTVTGSLLSLFLWTHHSAEHKLHHIESLKRGRQAWKERKQ